METSEILSQFNNLPKSEQAKLAAIMLGKLCNTFSMNDVSKEFIHEMNREHRTIQQSFTKMMLEWMEHVSSENYRTDLRNEDSKKCVKTMIEKFKSENGFYPSEFIRMI